MKNRATLAAVVALWAGMASAETLVDQVTRQLAAQGYTEITVSKTWLGRIRVEASGGTATREIILNPRTGEILRDYWEDEDGGEKGLLSARRGRSDAEEGGASDEEEADDDFDDDDADDDTGDDDDSDGAEDDDDHDDDDDGDDDGDDDDD